MKKGILIVIGVILVLGLTGGAYWLGNQGKKAPPTQLFSPTKAPSPFLSPVVVSPTPAPQKGIIEGSLSFPGEGIPDYIQVCAENQTNQEVTCTSEHLQNPKFTYGLGYLMEVPVGTYLVYAFDPNRDYKAYYSEFVTCGLSVNCPSHQPILVEVKAGETISEIDPQDWYQ